MKICSYPDCGRPHYSRELCQTHNKQRARREALRPIQFQRRPRIGKCQGPRCEHWGNYGGLCWSHHQQRKCGEELRPLRAPAEETCSFPGCWRDAKSLSLCQAHYRQSRQRDGQLRPVHVPTYRYVSKDGYVRLKEPAHPNADGQGRVLEHTKIMSEMLDRPLRADENVHHINGIRGDNRPENLELWCTKQPKGQRVEDKVEWAREILRRYAPEALVTSGV